MPATLGLPEIESNVPDANDCGLGVFLFPFSGLPPTGLSEEEEHGVVEGRQCQRAEPQLPPRAGERSASLHAANLLP